MSSTGPLLAARGLAFAYGRQPVFATVDLTIARREIVCLIGASGCGKSTLLRVLAGLAEPSAGDVVVDGADDPGGQRMPSGQSRAAKASVVFQSPALLPWLTVAENAGFGLDFACRPPAAKALRAERVARSLAQVGLAEHADKKPLALSGGMAQRVALARALARAPEIIYLDEPFSALDAITRESMQDLLLELAQHHQSAALLVTHDIDEALRIGDRVLLLARPQAEQPARIVGEWRPGGAAPRKHRSSALNAMREEILNTLSDPSATWYPAL
ncbi:ABC transporter ATP-binding protein [Rhodocyclus tenuis]|uniref:NitT/TauT family transport system ATP-binding protein n=1 Tax=Rhodocyclus tenuis TaxID=1066 RepID=A0A840G2H9_RHOTE|nr:ABC transporter ATP-binding protein [Rhodocyclus tenuis]MBB4248597.1 NitT/TauT family transport system ATP-binding protein [Rhodocyclus tenuis]